MNKMYNSIKKVFSENPENDLWRELLTFSYDENVKKYLLQNGLSDDDEIINIITGSFLQAYEYYKLAKESNLQIAPLLLYYGSTNLLNGMSVLMSGKKCEIKNHGMKIHPDNISNIADTKISFLSVDSGGIHIFSKSFGFNFNLTEYGDWYLSEFLDSIAEIHDDYVNCYKNDVSKIIMLDVFNTQDGKVEKVYYTQDNEDQIKEQLCSVEGFDKSYLHPVPAKKHGSQEEYFVLRHKINGKDISEISYSGQPYLRASHFKNSKKITIPTVINMYISLFVLASLCRYYPEKWSPFVQKDTTGEKLLIEKFLFFARRIIPNIVLDYLLNKKMLYVSDKYQPTDTIKHVSEHEVKELIKKEVAQQKERDMLLNKSRI